MSRYSFLIFVFIGLFFFGCEQPKPVEIDEDLNYMTAVDRLENRDYKGALAYYQKLYDATKKSDYFHGVLESLSALKRFKDIEQKSKVFLKQKKDLRVKRYLIFSLYKSQKIKEAIVLGEELLKESKKESIFKDYLLVADLYLNDKQFQRSLNYYKKAYEINPTNPLVDKISYLLFEKLGKKQEGIKYLETHIRINECDVYLCGQLANYYLKLGDIESIIEVYKRIYKKTDDDLIGKKIVELYILRKNYDGLASFLEETNLDNTMLLEIYKIKKDYQGLIKVSKDLYEESMDVKYLAQNAMFEFEYSKNKSKKLLNKTVEKLEEVIKSNNNPLYLNYLGYILIDYEIDVKKGLKLVEEALEQDKKNVYYKDSQAWGEYKLKNYQKAYNIMKLVYDKSSDKTVKEHFKKIKRSCKKSKKCKVD
ncbi:MAG: hypothetical protein OIF32_05640 [Campylobacterales bacterium]|nr:hypothetical protein [Campylobacterales bacterium]